MADQQSPGPVLAAGSPESERSPLLSRPQQPRRQNSWSAEMWLLAKISAPVVFSYILQNSLQSVSVLIVGRLSPEALATAAFSYMFAMSTAWLIALGGTTALDTLASSSFTASTNKQDLGILLQRGIVVLTAFCKPAMAASMAGAKVDATIPQMPSWPCCGRAQHHCSVPSVKKSTSVYRPHDF